MLLLLLSYLPWGFTIPAQIPLKRLATLLCTWASRLRTYFLVWTALRGSRTQLPRKSGRWPPWQSLVVGLLLVVEIAVIARAVIVARKTPPNPPTATGRRHATSDN